MAVAEQVHRMTVDEYVRIVRELGWERTELIDGVVYDVGAEYNRHAGTVMHVFRLADAQFTDGVVYAAGSVTLDVDTMFKPNIYVLEPTVTLDPDDAVPVRAVTLAIEVSVTTQHHDEGPKLSAYARSGVPEVWLIDPRPEAGRLTRYRNPNDGAYSQIDHFDVGENAADLDVTAVTTT